MNQLVMGDNDKSIDFIKDIQHVSKESFFVGDYVFAAKFSDAHPYDRWRVDVVDSIEELPNGKTCIFFEHTRKMRFFYALKITKEQGDLILKEWKGCITD